MTLWDEQSGDNITELKLKTFKTIARCFNALLFNGQQHWAETTSSPDKLSNTDASHVEKSRKMEELSSQL